MAGLSDLIARGEVCCCLRAKQMFYETGEEENGGADGPFWCAQTQSLVGPDGKVASAQDCRSGRACCELA